MKKLILLLALIAIGCNAPVTEGHGFWAGGEGDETFVAGPSESTDNLWTLIMLKISKPLSL